MELTCPNCSSRFRAPDDAFAAGPRKVRCGRCRHVWTASGEPVTPAPAAFEIHPAPDTANVSEERLAGPSEAQDVYADYPAPVSRGPVQPIITAPAPSAPPPAPEPSAPASAPAPVLQSDAPAPAQEQEDWASSKSAGGFPRYQEDEHVRGNEGKRGGLLIGWVLFFLVLIGVLAGGWHFRDQVVQKVPQLQKLYDMIDAQLAAPGDEGLELRGVTSVLRTIGGDRRMVIEGSVVNVSQEPQAVPLLRALILDSSGNQIAQWDFDPGAKSLDPGDRVEFSTSTSAPEGESQLDLIFVPR